MADDIDNTFMQTLLQSSINVDFWVGDLQRIAILYSRCGSDQHQKCWYSTNTDLQADERAKVSEIKRGNHPHRICKRRPQPDDNEIVTFLDGNYSTTMNERCKNGKLTKGELRDIQHKYRAKEESGQRIKVPSEVRPDGGVPYYKPKKYDHRIDIASTKPSECNRELQRLLQDVILPKDYEDIKEHQSNSVKGVEQRHVSKGIDLTINSITWEVQQIRNLADDFSYYSDDEFIHHPYHHHKNITLNICNELDSIINNLCQLEFGNIQILNSKLYNICNYIINTTIPSLDKTTSMIRSNIIIMQGSFYSKSHAVSIVTQHNKHSNGRASIIKELVDDKKVPSRKALDKLLTMQQNNQFIVEDRWSTRYDHQLINHDLKLEKEQRITSITDVSAHVEHHRMEMVKKIRERHLHRGYVPKGHSSYEQAVEQKKCHDDIIARGLETTDTTTEAAQYAEALTDDMLKKAGYCSFFQSWTRDAKKDIIKEIVAKQNELQKEAESEHIKMDKVKIALRIASITEATRYIEHHCMTKVQNQIRKQKYPHQGYYSKRDWEQFKNIIADGLEEDTTTPADAITYIRSLSREKRSCLDIKVDIVKEIVARQNQLSKEKGLELIKLKVNQLRTQYTQIGSLILSVQTVTMGSNWTPNITTKLYAPPIPTQISNTIGLTGDRLYFSPHQFPVTDVDTAGDSEAFQQLKDYIKHQSSLVGDSPLVFHGTESGGKRFICKYALKSNWKEQFGPFKRCTFAIVVKWDKYGFYINSSKPKPLHNRVKYGRYGGSMDIIQRKCVVGCEFHCHPTTSNKLSMK